MATGLPYSEPYSAPAIVVNAFAVTLLGFIDRA